MEAAGPIEAAGPAYEEEEVIKATRKTPGGSSAWPGWAPARAGPGVDSPDRFATDLSHDGALSPQILEAQGQETVDDKCCQGTRGDSEGRPWNPSACRHHQIHSAYPGDGDGEVVVQGQAYSDCESQGSRLQTMQPQSRSQMRQSPLGTVGAVCVGRCMCVRLRVPA